MSFFSLATIVSVGLMIGVELAVWVFINPVVWTLENGGQAHAAQLFAKRLGTAMPFWYTANFMLLVVETTLERGHAAFRLLSAASGIWAAVIVLTLIFLVPINNRLARPDASWSIEHSHRQHLRWHAMHRARVIALGAAFVLLLIGLRF